MAQLTIELPAELEGKLRRRIAGSGYTDAQDYIQDLIESDVSDLYIPAPDHLSRKTKGELEKLIQEGLTSGSSGEMRAEDWAARRHQLVERYQSKAAK